MFPTLADILMKLHTMWKHAQPFLTAFDYLTQWGSMQPTVSVSELTTLACGLRNSTPTHLGPHRPYIWHLTLCKGLQDCVCHFTPPQILHTLDTFPSDQARLQVFEYFKWVSIVPFPHKGKMMEITVCSLVNWSSIQANQTKPVWLIFWIFTFLGHYLAVPEW